MSAEIFSMTGFGSGRSNLPQSLGGATNGDAADSVSVAAVVVEVRSVNHRSLELRSKASGELSEHLPFLEDVIRKEVQRGRVDLMVRLDADLAADVKLDVVRARLAFEQLVSLRDALAPNEQVPLSLLASVPHLFAGSKVFSAEEIRSAASHALRHALTELFASRLREGAQLTAVLLELIASMRSSMNQIQTRLPAFVLEARTRLQSRLEVLLQDRNLLDQNRLEQEVAILVDRSDVSEENARLLGHLEHAETTLKEGGTVGRKLEFIAQEMIREANTLGSKTIDVELSKLCLALKLDVERFREQVANIV